MNRAAEQRSRTTARYSLRKYVGQDRANRSQGTFEPRTSTSPIAMEQLLWADAGHASADLGERTTALRSCRGSLPRVVRRSRAQELRAIRKALENNQKNRDGSFRGLFAPPVAPPGTFSPPRRVREKRVISKALTEWAGYRPRRLRPIFPLSSAVFSAGWELRQFSTQLGF
jgi:hypothetical protein